MSRGIWNCCCHCEMERKTLVESKLNSRAIKYQTKIASKPTTTPTTLFDSQKRHKLSQMCFLSTHLTKLVDVVYIKSALDYRLVASLVSTSLQFNPKDWRKSC